MLSLLLLSLFPLAFSSHLPTSSSHLQIRNLAQSTPPPSNISTPPEWDSFIYVDGTTLSVPESSWFDVSTGLMVFDGENDYGVDEGTVVKRDISDGSTGRDRKRGVVRLEDDGMGGLRFPRSWKEVKDWAKKVKRKTYEVVITWYDGKDLLNPSCGDKSDWTPTDSSLIFARTIVWDKGPACGQFLALCNKSNKKKCVYVREWDTCGGCTPGVPHVDLTQAAFSKMYALSVGLVDDVVATLVDPPFSTWGKAQVEAYGPKIQ